MYSAMLSMLSLGEPNLGMGNKLSYSTRCFNGAEVVGMILISDEWGNPRKNKLVAGISETWDVGDLEISNDGGMGRIFQPGGSCILPRPGSA